MNQNEKSEKLLKILIVTSSSYPHIGGLSSHIESLKKGFEQIGNKVDILSTSSINLINKIFLRAPIKLIIKFDRFVADWWYVSATKLIQSIYILIKQIFYRYDIIYTQTVISYNATHFVRKIFKVPVVLTVHHYLAYEKPSEVGVDRNYAKRKRFLLNEELKAYTSADVLVTVDSRLKKYLVEDFDIDESKINVFINCVDVQEFYPMSNKDFLKTLFNLPKNKKIILCPRRLVKKNGVLYAALAIKYIKQKHGNNPFVLVYAGDGEEKQEICRVIKEYSLMKNIIFIGSIEHQKMNYLYNASDIVIIPSINIEGVEEATSISALEAMASGVPVIASNVGGLKEIIQNKKTGFLIDEKNPEILGDTIYNLTNVDTESVINNAQTFIADNCSHIEMAKKFIKLYNKF